MKWNPKKVIANDLSMEHLVILQTRLTEEEKKWVKLLEGGIPGVLDQVSTLLKTRENLGLVNLVNFSKLWI